MLILNEKKYAQDIYDGKNKDVTDWLESGKTPNDLLQVIKSSLNILDKTILQQDEKEYMKQYKK